MDSEISKELFKGTDGINSYNLDEWFKIFRSYASVCEQIYGDKKLQEAIELGAEVIEIYNIVFEQLKKDKLLNKKDIEIVQSKFRCEGDIPPKLSNQKYQGLDFIKRIMKYLGYAYRGLAEEAYSAKDYTKALKLSKNALLYGPKDVLVNFTLAKTLAIMKANREAADSYEVVVKYDKNYNEGKRLLAELYKSEDIADTDKSIKNYSEYLQKAESDKYSWINYAGQLYKLGLHKECARACEMVFKLDATIYTPIIVYMLNLLKIDGYDQESIKNITERVIENHIKASGIKKHIYTFNNKNKDPNKKLKIGYLSSDLYNHVVSRFLLPIIENHNKNDFDIYLYAVSGKKDYVTEKYQKLTDHFEFCNQMNNNELAKKIYDDDIDILIDLNVHTGDARTIVMAQKPAPIQAIYLGYPNTSGLDTVDYILTDKDTIHPDEAGLYTEKPAYIDAGYEVISMDYSTVPEITPAPYIKNKYITMGVFNATAKVTDEMIKIWAYILHKAKNTKIMFQYIQYYTEENKKRILAEFAKYNIKENRIIFMGRHPVSHYHALAKADFALDTFPYSGTGTTMDSIMMGLPIVCVEGYHATSRPTSRILKAMNETDLISKDFDGYVENALKLINNPKLISEYRKKLRDKLNHSKLTDYAGFTASLEDTYRKMWRDYCNCASETK